MRLWLRIHTTGGRQRGTRWKCKALERPRELLCGKLQDMKYKFLLQCEREPSAVRRGYRESVKAGWCLNGFEEVLLWQFVSAGELKDRGKG